MKVFAREQIGSTERGIKPIETRQEGKVHKDSKVITFVSSQITTVDHPTFRAIPFF